MRSVLPCSVISNVFCQSPTDEDKYRFPDIAGSDWLETLHFAMRDFKDEKLYQPVPPKVMRDFVSSRYLMTGIIIWRSSPFITKKVIGDSIVPPSQYNLSNSGEPNIQVWKWDLRGDRSFIAALYPFRITARRWPKAAKEVLNMCIGYGA